MHVTILKNKDIGLEAIYKLGGGVYFMSPSELEAHLKHELSVPF